MTLETMPCKVCKHPTSYLGTQLCQNCWEIMRRVETFCKSRGGRKVLRQHLRRYSLVAVWFKVEYGSLYIHTRYWVLEFERPSKWRWEWGHWRPKSAPANNWSRFRCWFPIGTFDVKGFLFWGKKPEKKGD